ncbi:hypothetical protein BDF21DRAFT_484809 [Thamnidium elegans]|nr:hypothetical protein BDF21DRAFT_484809 [Thamnidium elegans]
MVTLKWNSLKRMNLLKILSALNWGLIKIIETLESFYLLLRKKIMLKINLITNNERRQHQVLLKNLKNFQENVRDPTVENPTENAPLQDHLKLPSLHRTNTLVSKKLSTLKPKIYETYPNGCTMIYAATSLDTVRLNVLIHAIPDLNFVLLKNLEKHPLLEKLLAPTVAARDTAPTPSPSLPMTVVMQIMPLAT